MTHARRMIETSPSLSQVEAATLAECIEACFDCAQTCTLPGYSQYFVVRAELVDEA